MQTFSDIKSADQSAFMQTYARYDVAFTRGEGARLYDVSGKEYIDFSSGIGVNSLGTGHPAWVAAITAQAAALAHCSNLYYNPAAVTLAQKLSALTGGYKVFFGNSGAEANEGMIKLARKHAADNGKPGGTIITLNNSFHGRTISTLAATGQEAFHQYFHPFTPGFVYADPDMDSVKAADDGSVIAIIIEMVQGEGGVLPLTQTFVDGLKRYAAEKGWLICVDEIQTGVGRTGSMFAFEQYDLQPDIFTLAKGIGGGLPIGAVVAKPEVAASFGAYTHGSTFGANPVACAGAAVVLDTVSDPNFLDAVNEKAAYIRRRLSEPGLLVKEVRGLGLMIGISLDNIDAKALVAKLLGNGVVALTAKDVLRLLPPLVITADELARGMDIIVETIKNM